MLVYSPHINIMALVAHAREHGGLTLSMGTNLYVTRGYAVSIPGHEKRVPWVLLESDVARYLAGHAEALAMEGACFGLWWDDDTNEWVYDVTLIFDNEDQAITRGAQWGQKAIYDLRKEMVLLVPQWMTYYSVEQGGVA